MSRAPERQLRRMIADLAGKAPAEIEAILAELNPQQASRVRSLLARLTGENVPVADAPVENVWTWSPSLAPWLRERLDENLVDNGELSLRPPRPAMTLEARAALGLAAKSAGAWVEVPRVAPLAPAGKPGLRERLGWWLQRGAR